MLAKFSEVSPINNDGAEQQCSTTSNPLKISPRASAKVLPCSAVISWAKLSVLSRINCCNFKNTLARLDTEVSLHFFCAITAFFTASCNSSLVDCGVLAKTSWFNGLITSNHSVAFDSWNCPLNIIYV